jgi:hypothetical protein
VTATSLYDRELAALEDAARLAELWEHALRASFDLGQAAGFQEGLLAGRHEEADAWQAIVTGYSALMDKPTREEMARLRRPSNEPCRTRCSRCSQCTRAAAVVSNLARYRCPDFPGLDHIQRHIQARREPS